MASPSQVSRLALSGLRNWTTAALPNAVFAARHFRPFLPPPGQELGQPWWIIPGELSVFTGYLSNNRFYPPPPKGKEVRKRHLNPSSRHPSPSVSVSRAFGSRAVPQFMDPGPGAGKPAATLLLPLGHHPPPAGHVPSSPLREDPLCPSGHRGLPDCHQRFLLYRDVPVSVTMLGSVREGQARDPQLYHLPPCWAWALRASVSSSMGLGSNNFLQRAHDLVSGV